MSARDRTPWMDLDALKSHCSMHALQATLMDMGLERLGTEGPAFILMHTGAALRPNGIEARSEVLEAIEEKARQLEAEAQAAQSQADKWRDIRERMAVLGDDDTWKNPLWEREMMKAFRKELRGYGTGISMPSRHSKRLFHPKFRRGFSYRDVVCVQKGAFSAFKVDRSELDMMHTAPSSWKALFPEVEFTRQVHRWMVFPKDLSGGTTIAYLQFGNKAGPKVGRGHTRRYDINGDQWREGDSIESWVS